MSALDELESIIASRSARATPGSWTSTLLQSGRHECAKKMGEEAVEAAIAGAAGSRKEMVKETADLLYHLLVMLRANEVSLGEVYRELESRQSMSGLQEKASRH